MPNTLLIPLRMENHRHAIDRHDARRMIQEGARFNIGYSDLPMIFCSVIQRDLFEQLRRKTGRAFKSRTPDVYAAFAIAHVAGVYHSLNAPLAIAGISGKSTGMARHFVKGSSAIDGDFRHLNDRAGHALHAHIPDLPPIASAVGDAFLYAKEALFADDASMTLDRRRLIAICLRETEVDTEEEWRHVLTVCRHALSDDAELLAWFDSAHGNLSFDARPKHVRKQVEKRYGGMYLNLDASEFGVADVADAAQLCEKLLGYKRDGVNAQLRSDTAAVSPLSELQEKEAVIQLLDRTCKERLALIEQLSLHIRALEQRPAEQPPSLVRGILRRLLTRGKSRDAA